MKKIVFLIFFILAVTFVFAEQPKNDQLFNLTKTGKIILSGDIKKAFNRLKIWAQSFDVDNPPPEIPIRKIDDPRNINQNIDVPRIPGPTLFRKEIGGTTIIFKVGLIRERP